MKRKEFEHAIRAAGAVLGTDEVLVIGSQALHASVREELPEEALRSIEVDVSAMEDPDGRMADLIDGSIGEASMFHATFGYYARGVVPTTAVLPHGWRERLVRFETPATNGVVAWCLEPHDLWLSKMVAGRPKDLEFAHAVLTAGIVRAGELRSRIEEVPDASSRTVERIRAKIDAWEGQVS